jgi:hypothetical protein
MMPKTRSRKIADLLSPASVAGTLSVDGGGGVATYTSIGDLPSSGLTAGDMAFVDSSDRLYIWAGSGWYNIALINRAPTIQSVLDSDGGSSPFALSNEGVATTITMLAQDSDGTLVTYSAVPSAEFNAMATVSQLSNVFTITPTVIQSSTGTITFKASDGINLASEISTFILTFIIANSRYTSLLVQSVGTNNGVNSTFTDASANNLTLTAAGTPVTNTFSPYRAGGYSTYFDGAGDYIYTDNPLLNTEDFTIECWVFCKDGATDKGVWDCHTSSSSTDGLTLTRITGTTFRLWGTGQLVASSSITITDTWVHVAAVRISGALTLFVNGISQGTASFSTNISNNNGFVIGGGRYSPSQSPVAFVNAYIRDFRIIKGTGVYTSNFTPPTEPLTAIAGTTLLTCQNGYFVDNSVSAHAITTFGNTSVVPFGPYDHGPYDPAVNRGSMFTSLSLNSNNFLTTAATSALEFGSENFTIEFWWYPTSTSRQALYHASYGTDWSVGIDFNGTGVQSIGIWASSNGSSWNLLNADPGGNAVGTLIVKQNAWNHFAYVRNGTTWQSYLNGVLDKNLTGISGTIVSRSSSGKAIGSWYSAGLSTATGHLSNFRIIKGTAVYTAAFTSPTEPLTAISGTSLLINATASIIDASQSSALTLVGNTKSSTTQIKYGNSSMYFDGTGDYLKVLGTMPTLSADFTIEFWYYQNTTGQYDSLFTTVYAYATANSLRISTGANNNTLQVASGTAGILNSNTAFSNTTWLHIALVRSGSTMTLYQNGVSVGSATNTQSFISSDFTIGDASGAGSPYYLDGYIQDLRVTKGLARYTTTFTPPAALLEG